MSGADVVLTWTSPISDGSAYAILISTTGVFRLDDGMTVTGGAGTADTWTGTGGTAPPVGETMYYRIAVWGPENQYGRPELSRVSATVEVFSDTSSYGVTSPTVGTLKYIPGGSFYNGTSTVTVSGFLMSEYEVTQSQYEAVIGLNPSYFSDNPDAATSPVEAVSWYDALVFCNRLSLAEGLTPCYSIGGSTDPADWGTVPTVSDSTWNASVLNMAADGFRLPTEAEWEYAARAGTTTTYYWGDDSSDATVTQYAWYNYNAGGRTHGVGQKLPNAWGLYDMSGNVSEWCWDWYGSYPSGDQTDPTGASTGTNRVIRGGAWFFSSTVLGSAYRTSFVGSPDLRDVKFGFRLVSRQSGS